jgi:hypothetical protein
MNAPPKQKVNISQLNAHPKQKHWWLALKKINGDYLSLTISNMTPFQKKKKRASNQTKK